MNKEEDRIELMNCPGYGSVPPVQENSNETRERKAAKGGISGEHTTKSFTYPFNRKFLVFCMIIDKLLLITFQVCLLAKHRSEYSDIVNRGHITLRHLLLKGWGKTMETDPYPPARGEFAVYELEELKESINFAVERYFNAEEAIGFYELIHHKGRNDSMTIRMRYFDFPGFDSSMTGLQIEEYNHPVGIGLHNTTDPITNQTRYTYNIEELFDLLNIIDPVRRVLTVHLDFTIHSLRVYEDLVDFDCLFTDGTVNFLGDGNKRQMVGDLNTTIYIHNCVDIGYNVTHDLGFNNDDHLTYNILVASIATLSYPVMLFMYYCNIRRQDSHTRPEGTTRQDAMQKINEENPEKERKIEMWIKAMRGNATCKELLCVGLIFVSDVLTVTGFWLQVAARRSYTQLSDLDNSAIFLGIGGFLSNLIIFRFINKIHWTFDIISDTLYRAFRIMLAYLVSIGVLFFGFVLCGYLILGPYNAKFKTVSTTMETLFLIGNGDELYATFAEVESGNNVVVQWFSRFYICIYVAVFTIVVINIFVAIFVKAYEGTLKEHQKGKKQEEHKGEELETVV